MKRRSTFVLINMLWVALYFVGTAFLTVAAASETPGVGEPLRATRGEIVPGMLSPNLLLNGDFDHGFTGWTLVDEGDADVHYEIVPTEEGPVLLLHKKGHGPARLVSDRIPIRSGAQYQVTAVYHTEDATFGNMAEFTLIEVRNPAQDEARDIPSWRPSPSAILGHRGLFNSAPDQWRRKTRQFTVSSQAKQVRLVLTIEGPPVTLMLDNIYFSEPNESVRTWTAPLRELPTRIADRQRMLLDGRRKLMEREDSTATVRTENGIPRLFVDGQPSVPQVHMGDVSNSARAYFKQFGEHNLDVHIISLRNIWTSFQTFDLAAVDSILWDGVLRDPLGHFIVNISLTPYLSWHEDFPEHAAQSSQGEYATSRHDRFAPPDYWSEEYRQQVYEYVETVVNHIHSQPYGKAVIGYFITGGEDGQFYYQVSAETLQDGMAPGSLSLFQQWMRERYPSIDLMRHTWEDPGLTYETVRPPVQNTRYPGTFMDPAIHKKDVDYITYLNEELARFLINTAQIIKKAVAKDIIVGAYYGRGASLQIYPMFAQEHVMLQSDAIDFMGGQPGYYGWRDVGSEGHLTWVFDSVRSHGKLMMVELDFRTWQSEYRSLEHDFSNVRYWNLDDLQAAAMREIGKAFSVMGGAWWMEMTGGWFHDDEIMDMIRRLHDASQELYEEEPSLSPSDIVFVADEKSYFWSTEQFNKRNGPNFHSLNTQQRAINRSGVTYHFVYLSDLIRNEMDHYKVYVFLNHYYATEEERHFIETRLKRDGKILLWQYAPGYVTSEKLSLEAMAALTDIRFGTDSGSLQAHFVNQTTDMSPLAGAMMKEIEGSQVGIGFVPVIQRFYVEDPDVEVLARYSDGKAAVAIRPMDSHTSVYVGHPSGLTPRFIANLAEVAGVHNYIEPGDLFMYHRKDFIVIHGVEGGNRVLRFPFDVRLTDLIGEREFPRKSKEFELTVQPGESLWLKVETEQ